MKYQLLFILLFSISSIFAREGKAIVFQRPVSPVQSDNAAFFRGCLRLSEKYIQDSVGRIVMEAETPSAFESENLHHPEKSFATDPSASGAEYSVFLMRAKYRFTVEHPGKFHVWYRAWYPAAGHWNHSEFLDNPQSSVQVSDFKGESAKKSELNCWVWRQGPLRDLTVGEHLFVLEWRGGSRLDQIAFLPEGSSPLGQASLPSTAVAAKSPVDIFLEAFTVPEGEKVIKLQYEPFLNKGTIIALFSQD